MVLPVVTVVVFDRKPAPADYQLMFSFSGSSFMSSATVILDVDGCPSIFALPLVFGFVG